MSTSDQQPRCSLAEDCGAQTHFANCPRFELVIELAATRCPCCAPTNTPDPQEEQA